MAGPSLNRVQLSIFNTLWKKAVEESADYADQNMRNARLFGKKELLLDYAINQSIDDGGDGLIAEFGVWSGKSINQIARRLKPRTVFGYDSFEGLPESWKWGPVGQFSTQGKIPPVDSNVCITKGWFSEETFNNVLNNFNFARFLHIDCDLYSSAKIVLECFEKMIQPGTVILFDEYFAYPTWQQGEFKAWQEFIKEKEGLDYKYIGFADTECSVAIKVTEKNGKG